MQILELDLPDFWATTLVNGDKSHFNDEDEKAFEAFTDDMMNKYGACWCINCSDEENGPGFLKYHDAKQYGVLACNCLTFSFDVSQEH